MNTTLLNIPQLRLDSESVRKMINSTFDNTVGYWDIMESLPSNISNAGYPPFNMFKEGQNKYTIELAVAGFMKSELKISVENGCLTVEGECNREPEQDVVTMIKGISNRKFAKHWNLADYVEVKSAEFDNGILRIKLEREVPEELQKKTVKIK